VNPIQSLTLCKVYNYEIVTLRRDPSRTRFVKDTVAALPLRHTKALSDRQHRVQYFVHGGARIHLARMASQNTQPRRRCRARERRVPSGHWVQFHQKRPSADSALRSFEIDWLYVIENARPSRGTGSRNCVLIRQFHPPVAATPMGPITNRKNKS
jgi:hypothetical protein